MYYQTLVKNLFNDMHHFLNGVQAISLEDLKDNYQEEPLFLAFIGNLDQAAAVDYNAAMNESYAFYKKFCGKGLAEEDWDLVILEVQEFNKNWENIWCKGLILALLDILDREGEAALGKPAGSYRTLDLTAFWQRGDGFFDRAVRAVGQQVKELTPDSGPVLVVGLGNRAMTPDAIGPLAADSVLITRHLIDAMPQHFSGFRPVAALRPGVLGTTGVESAEAVRGLVDRLHPSAVIAVDALASRRVGRVCCTVQFSDTGIIPGSGVGNHRSALNRETLGVPVLAVGVPTVVDAATLAADLLEESGLPEPDMETLRSRPENLMVTPRDIDQQVRDLGKVIGYSINWALQDLEIEEINALLS